VNEIAKSRADYNIGRRFDFRVQIARRADEKGFSLDSAARENYKQRLSPMTLIPAEPNRERFEKMLIELMARPTPDARPAGK
jgi:hypothetical protein